MNFLSNAAVVTSVCS